MGSNRKIMLLIEQSSNWDKDNRFMALSDILTELDANLKMESALEQKCCIAVLKRLDDTSADCQTAAVKCLSQLVTKVEDQQVSDICSKLCNLMLEGDPALRDIYSIGLKSVLENVPAKLGPGVARQLSPRLLGGVAQSSDDKASAGAKLECLDILAAMLKLYGDWMNAEHSNISSMALKQLGNSETVVCKRATACLGQLATVVSNELLDKIVQNLLSQIEKPHSTMEKRTVISTIGSISRMVGYRLGSHLGRIVPLFLAALKDPSDELMHNDAADELRENILHAFESFMIRCPHEATEHILSILEVLAQFLQYDPNYNYGDVDGGDEDMDGDDDEYSDDEFDDEEYSDEDDTSWKVRRASIKVLRAVVISRPEMLEELYKMIAPLLLSRFTERDEYVRLDIITCYTELVNTSVSGSSGSGAEGARFGAETPASSAMVLSMISNDVPRVVKQSSKILKDKKGVKAKIAVFHMLSAIVLALRGGLDEHMDVLMPFILENCKIERDSSLVHETLQFTNTIMELHAPTKIQPHIAKLCPAVLTCISAEWYKIVAEALNVVRSMSAVFRPASFFAAGENGMETDVAPITPFDCSAFVQPCYTAVLPRLQMHDIDMEIKENAIMAMAAIFSRLGDMLPAVELGNVLMLLHERLSNEITRLPALKCIEQIAASPLRLDLSSVVASMVVDLVQFLRQQSRTLKQHTLSTLEALVKSNNGKNSLTPERFAQVIENSTKLIDSNDLYLSQMSISLCVSVIKTSNGDQGTMQLVRDQVLPRCMVLLCKSGGSVQGSGALQALLVLFHELVLFDSPELPFESLITLLVASASADSSAPLPKPSLEALARCVATVTIACKDDVKRSATIQKIVTDICNSVRLGSFDNTGIALLSLGEIGRSFDLVTVAPGAYDNIMACLDHSGCPDDVKSAAATALGNVSLGNMSVFLPTLMQVLQDRTEQAKQYLLLSSLREVIVRHGAAAATSTSSLPVDSILPVLKRHCMSEEEGVRNMVAECLGKLVVQNPDKIVPYIANMAATAELPLVRWTLVTSVKYASATDCPYVAKALKANTAPFVKLLADNDLHVRRAAIVSFNSIAHHRPAVIRDIAKDDILPALFQMTKVDKSLKRTVNLGPFKHTVDDGLPLRKASFSCVLTMFDTMPEMVPVATFLPHLAAGLGDVDDVAMLCHQTVAHIVAYSPHALLSEVNIILTPLSVTIKKTPKAQQQGVMNHDNDVIRSALRALDAINAVPESSQNKKIQELVAQVLGTTTLRALAEADHLAFLSNVKM